MLEAKAESFRFRPDKFFPRKSYFLLRGLESNVVLQLCSIQVILVGKMLLVSGRRHCFKAQLSFSQSRSGLSAPGPPRFLPLPLSRAYHTTRSQRADVFPSQLNDPSAAAVLSSLKTPRAPQTLTEKIVQRYSLGLSEGQYVKAGDYVTLSPAICMTHDNSWPTALKFMSIGASQIYNKQQVVMTLDHDVQNKSESNLKKYRQIEEFAKKQGVAFYPAGRGIGHQIMVEEGFAYPGTLCR